MATLPPAAVMRQPQPDVYQPLKGAQANVGPRLDEMVREGRVVVARERFRRQRNREAYRGNTYLQPLTVRTGGQLTRMAPADLLPSGRRRDSLNRLRQFVDGRVTMYTSEKPAHQASPASREKQAVDGARVATRFIDFQWDNVDGWNIAAFGRTAALWAEQDGISFGCVTYDRSAGAVVSDMQVPDPSAPGGFRSVEDRSEIEALLEQDPNGERLWRNAAYPTGEVVIRPVRVGSLAFDPNFTTDWRQCSWVIEGRRRKIVDLERELGKSLNDLIGASNQTLRRTSTSRSGGTVDTEDGGERSIDIQREVMVYELFHKPTGPTGEFPDGAHIMWAQDAPAMPFVQETWLWPDGTPRGLPYFPFVPRPDGGHMLTTMGTTDELYPIQRQFDRRHSQYGEWLDLVARPPLLMVGGSLRSKSVYNADRVVHVNPGFDPPRFMTVPPDPGIALMNMMNFLVEQMSEVAIQSAAVRGQQLPGIEAASAYNQLITQGEGQLGGTEAQYQGFLQGVVSEALRNVHHFYTISRKVRMPAVDDEAEFINFTSSAIAGAINWRITSSVLPRNKAAQQQLLIQFMQYAGPRFDPTPYASEILEGDVESIITLERAQGRKQERENNMIAAIGSLPDAQKIWGAFVQMRDAYAQTLLRLAGVMKQNAQALGVAPSMNPQQVMAQFAKPPRVIDILSQAGYQVPRVAISDRDAMHVRSLEMFMTNDAFDDFPDIVKQVALEHLNEHLDQQTRRTAAMAVQTPQMANATPGAQPPQAAQPPQEQQ